MPMKKATKDKLTQAFESGYQAGYADGQRAAQVEIDAKEAASAVYEAQLESNGDDDGAE